MIRGFLFLCLLLHSGLLSAQPGPVEELSTGASDPTLNYINWARYRYPHIDGRGIRILVKERAFDTADIDFRNRVFATPFRSDFVTSHAALMATLIAGGGNTSPFAAGAAPGALVGSASFARLYPEPDSALIRLGISIVNHSYGTVIENFYGPEARAYDSQAVRLPHLLHIFSAGNSGAAGGGSHTGNFKWARNALTVGAQDSAGAVLTISSRGPSPDGRFKPDLVAFGEDGASGAAALVSGTAALLADAYRKTTGKDAPSALLRAALINSATDMGPEGPDSISGWGALHAEEALAIITEGRYAVDTVSPAGLVRRQFTVPPNAALLKATLSWTDSDGPKGAAGRLQQQMDLVLRALPSGREWRLADTVNTHERISVTAPTAGAYELLVTGGGGAPQPVALAWSTEMGESLTFTYPTRVHPLLPAQEARVRWTGTAAGPGVLEYRINGGGWTSIAPVADGNARLFRWAVPDTSGVAQLRIRMTGSRLTVTSDSFAIAAQPVLEAGYACADSVLLQWKPVPGAAGYRLYALGATYLEPLAETADSTITLRNGSGKFYALAPILGGLEGLRSYTVLISGGTTGCFINAFYLEGQEGPAANFRAVLGTVQGVASVVLVKETGAGLKGIDSVAVPAARSMVFREGNLQPGENRFRLLVRLQGRGTVLSEVVVVYGLAPGQAALLYPNPSRRSEGVKVLTLESGAFRLDLHDASGRRLYSRMLNSTLTTLPANLLPPGVYFAQFIREGKVAGVQQVVVY